MGSLEDRPSSQLSSAVSCLRKKGKKKKPPGIHKGALAGMWEGDVGGGGGAALSAVNQGGTEVPFQPEFLFPPQRSGQRSLRRILPAPLFHIKHGVSVATGAGSFSKVERSPPRIDQGSFGMAGLADGKSIFNRVCASALLLPGSNLRNVCWG